MTSNMVSFVLVLALTLATNAFQMSDFFPNSSSVTVTEGEDLSLWCKSNDYWEWCRITQVASGKRKSCGYAWNRAKYDVKVTNCNAFAGRHKYIGDTGSHVYQCGIRVENVQPEDSGQWNCEITEYYDGTNKWERYAIQKGYGQVSQSFNVSIEAKTTTTATTATSTTTTTTPTTTTIIAATTTTETTTTASATTTATAKTTTTETITNISTTTTKTAPAITTSKATTTKTTIPTTTQIAETMTFNATITSKQTTTHNSVTESSHAGNNHSKICGGTINSDSYPSYTGIGTVVGIVLVCLVFSGSVFLAKKYNKCCFNNPYGVTNACGNLELVKPLNAEDETHKSGRKVDSENVQEGDERRLTV